MDIIRQDGKTVDEAISLALEKLEISKDEAEIEIIDEGTKGFLGLIGSKKALVEVSIKIDPAQIGKEFLEEVLQKIPMDGKVEVIEEQTNQTQVKYNINSSDLGILIGYRGETLDSLQYLTSLAVNKVTDHYYRVIIDAEGYRERRKQTLERLALKLARKALSKGRKVMLEPMPPHERRIIHITLKGDERIETFSDGKEPYRRIMIIPNKGDTKK